MARAVNFHKITVGFVIQVFDQYGNFVEQQFVARDQMTYEIEDGDEINADNMPLGGREYHPFEMKQSK